jgi:uncharacterized membrane protein
MAGTRSGRRRRQRTIPAQRGAGRGGSHGGAREAGAHAGAAHAGGRALAARAPSPPARWVQFTAFVLSLAGLGMSIYLTIEHFLNGSSLACPETGVINCAKVTTSPQSAVFGIPVAVLGLAFFVFMTAINSPPAWRAPWPAVRLIRLLSVIAGIGFVMYLIYAELLVIGNICLECTSVHVLTFALFVLIVFSMSGTRGSPAPRRR